MDKKMIKVYKKKNKIQEHQKHNINMNKQTSKSKDTMDLLILIVSYKNNLMKYLI